MKKLYIFLDGVRRDFLEPYGYYINNMPNIKRYLSKFQKLNMYSPASWTPSFFWSCNKKYSSQSTYHIVDLFGKLKHYEYIFSFMANSWNNVLGSVIYKNKKLIYDYVNNISYWTNLEKDPKEKNMEILGQQYMNSEARKYFALLNEKIDINKIKEILGGDLITDSIYVS